MNKLTREHGNRLWLKECVRQVRKPLREVCQTMDQCFWIQSSPVYRAEYYIEHKNLT